MIESKLPKFCIFCGEKPDGKSKEHVIPRWLIALTGDPKRDVILGIDKDNFTERKFSFDQFTFPACTKCNSDYSQLEGDAKVALEKILYSEALTPRELSIFLDWIDKVRVGLWLGLNQLDKNIVEIKPNFYIGSRIGQFDRMLIIERSDFNGKRTNMSCIDCLAFSITPSVFTLVVNNYFFTSISCFGLVSRRLGFPFSVSSYYSVEEGNTQSTFSMGKGRIMNPVFKKPLNTNGFVVHQPMFRSGLLEADFEKFYGQYEREHSLDFSEGTGNLFIKKGNRTIEFLDGDEMVFEPKSPLDDYSQMLKCGIRSYSLQNWVNREFVPDLREMPDEERKVNIARFRAAERFNNTLIEYHQKMLKESYRKRSNNGFDR